MIEGGKEVEDVRGQHTACFECCSCCDYGLWQRSPRGCCVPMFKDVEDVASRNLKGSRIVSAEVNVLCEVSELGSGVQISKLAITSGDNYVVGDRPILKFERPTPPANG